MRKRQSKILPAILFTCMAMLLLPVKVFADGEARNEGETDVTTSVEINESNFPEEYFRDYIARCYDKDGDGYLSSEELDAVEDLRLSYIEDVTGIEYFTKLKTLYCNYCPLKKLDVSKNTELTELVCDCIKITSLDVSKNKALQELRCSNSPLTELDVSKNTALRVLNVSMCKLTKLDVSKNTDLYYLDCGDNQLTELDVSNNTELSHLDCYKNELTELDISRNKGLSFLSCYNNELTELDVSNNQALTDISCQNNQLTELDVSHNRYLTILCCGGNELTELDLSHNKSLTGLGCNNNQLTELDLSQHTALRELNCDDNQLTKLDVSSNTGLQYLTCSNNQLTELDLSNNTELEGLGCSENKLTKLDIRNCIVLRGLNCNNNQLPALDISNCTKLKNLHCAYNKLTSLDISNNKLLQEYHITEHTYEIVLDENRSFDLSKLPGGIDISKMSDWDGGVVNGNILTVNAGEKKVSYSYACGGVRTDSMTFELTICNTVNFDTDGGSNVDTQMVVCGDAAQEPAVPTKKGYIFDGWYNGDDKYDFTENVTENLTLTAHWIQCDHTGYTEVRDAKTAGCTTDGYTGDVYCNRCDLMVETGSVIKATGHKPVMDAAIPATCISSGLTEGSHCSECNEILKAQEEIPATGKHVPSADGDDCTVEIVCKICGQTLKEAAKEHNWGEWTSNGDGSHTRYCNEENCKKSETEECNKGETVKSVAKATSSRDGKVVEKCADCGYTVSTTTIRKASKISISKISYIYDGKVKKPSVAVKDSAGKAVAAANYRIVYAGGCKNVGKYTVKIVFNGNYSGTVTKTFVIYPRTTTLSQIKAGKKQLTVTWKKQLSQTTGYQLQYSIYPGFKNAKTVTISKNSVSSKTLSKLMGNKKYYVRIRTYKTVTINGKSGRLYSSWSKTMTAKTK